MNGDILELRTDAELSSSGAAVARAEDGRVVFIHGAAPNERVLARVTRTKKRYIEAELHEILDRSAERVEPKCRLFGVCGGCVTQHVSQAAQARSKQRAFVDALERIGKLSTDEVEIDDPWSGAAYEYRARARFAVAGDGTVGYRARGGSSVVEVLECPVLAPKLAKGLVRLREDARPRRDISEVQILVAGDATLFEGASAPKDADSGPLEVIDAHGPLRMAATVFAQSNLAGNQAMLEYVQALAGQDRLESMVELYAGSGNVTRVLAPQAQRVLAVEGHPAAVELGRSLLPGVEWRCESIEEAAGRLLAEVPGPVDLVLIDPPRTGCDPKALAWIGGAAERLIYVSCGPSTFARDAARLGELGLRLRRARLFDFYPQTEHVETVALFERE